jgi:branched-chain amino acid transport system permease protein
MTYDWKKWLAGGLVSMGFIVLPLIFHLRSNIMNLLILMFVYVTLAQSFNVIGGMALQFHMGIAAFFGTSAFVTHVLWQHGVPISLAILVGTLASMVLSVIIGLPTLRLKGMYFAIGTIALAETLRIVVSNIWPLTIYMPVSVSANFTFPPRYYFALAIAVFACLVIAAINQSKLGLALVSLGDDQDAAQVTGINLFKYKVIALVISSMLAGLAGGVYCYFRVNINPGYLFVPLWSFEPIVATAIGGMGTLVGPIIGSFILVILSDIFALALGEAHLIIFGILFILVVLYYPYGIVGSFYKMQMLISHIVTGRAGAKR